MILEKVESVRAHLRKLATQNNNAAKEMADMDEPSTSGKGTRTDLVDEPSTMLDKGKTRK